MTENQFTSAREWRKFREEGAFVKLPSGFTARLRPVSMQWLYKSGKIPDALTTLVAEIIKAGDATIPDVKDAATAIIDLKIVVAKAAFINPTIVDEIKDPDSEILYEDLWEEDTEFVLSWAQRPQKELANFRTEQEPVVEPVLDSDDISRIAKSDTTG